MSDLSEILARLERIEAKLDELPKPRLRYEPALGNRGIDHAAVVERYKELRHMGAVASEFGVTSARIQQIISKHKEVSGEIIERVKFRNTAIKKRVLWECSECGVVRKLAPAAAELMAGKRCAACYHESQRKYSDKEMEEFVEYLKPLGFGRWMRLGERIGLAKNAVHLGQYMVFVYLLRKGRVAELWPDGPPYWMSKRVSKKQLEAA